jgi:phenylpyruvate tautomerase PptA (4-oxalocrotonate tautomerase family)
MITILQNCTTYTNTYNNTTSTLQTILTFVSNIQSDSYAIPLPIPNMPLWTIYHPPSTFTSPTTKAALARAITSIYTAVPLPAFYVNVLFQPIDSESFYVGGVARPSSSNDDVESPGSTVPLIRITIQNIARTL